MILTVARSLAQWRSATRSSDPPSRPAPSPVSASSDVCRDDRPPTAAVPFLDAVRRDFQASRDRGSAGRNTLEIALCDPGLHALILHRIAHRCGATPHLRKAQGNAHQDRRPLPFFPRLLAHLGRRLTGIDIHPGATLGVGICIDCGHGVVIGETARVGDGATLYQGVTLGGTGKDSGQRHPQLGRNVTVEAGAIVLGNLQIGDDVRIGAGAVVIRDVPDRSTVVGIPGRVVRHAGQPPADASGDRFDTAIADLHQRLDRLETQVRQLQRQPHTRLQPEEHREQTLTI